MNILEARRRLLGAGVYKKTVTGNPAVAQGSLARMYPGIEMQGWTEQAQYEGNQLFDKSGIVVTGQVQYIPVNVGDGEFTLSTQYNNTYRKDVFFLPGNVSDGASSSDNGVSLNKPVTVTSENGYVTVALRANSEGDTNPLDYNIMLNSGSTALPYEPYTGGQPSPSPDYPQEIVSAGNYDETSGKYKVDITLTGSNLIDFNQGQNDGFNLINLDASLLTTGRTYTFTNYKCNTRVSLYAKMSDGTDDKPLVSQYLNESDSANFEFIDNVESLYVGGLDASIASDSQFMFNPGTTPLPYEPYRPPQTVTLQSDRPLTKWDKLEKRNGQWGWVYKSAEIESYTDESVPGEYYSTTGQLSVGAQVWYETTTETFAPLTETEQEAMNALHTYRPTTVLSNQQDCEMTLTYKTRKGVGGGNLLDYRKLVNPAYWIGNTPTNAYKYFDIVLKNNTKYKLSCTKNNMNKDYIDEHPIDFTTTFYMGENPGTFNGNYCFGHEDLNTKQTEYQFTTTGNPYYLNLCINPANKFKPENLHIVFDELLPGLKLQEVT